MRSASRRKELAIRASLGAGRGRILRQLLTESAVLATLGGLGGLLLAYWASDLLKALPALRLAGDVDLRPDGRVLAFTLAIAVAAGVLFGVLPAIFGTVATSAIALVLALPIGLGAAIFLAELAPRWISAPVSFLIEMLAAIGFSRPEAASGSATTL